VVEKVSTEAVLQSALGDDRREFSAIESGRAKLRSVTSSYERISAAARECAFVASLGGRHTRKACVAGYELVREIGERVWMRLRASGPDTTTIP